MTFPSVPKLINWQALKFGWRDLDHESNYSYSASTACSSDKSQVNASMQHNKLMLNSEQRQVSELILINGI